MNPLSSPPFACGLAIPTNSNKHVSATNNRITCLSLHRADNYPQMTQINADENKNAASGTHPISTILFICEHLRHLRTKSCNSSRRLLQPIVPRELQNH